MILHRFCHFGMILAVQQSNARVAGGVRPPTYKLNEGKAYLAPQRLLLACLCYPIESFASAWQRVTMDTSLPPGWHWFDVLPHGLKSLSSSMRWTTETRSVTNSARKRGEQAYPKFGSEANSSEGATTVRYVRLIVPCGCDENWLTSGEAIPALERGDAAVLIGIPSKFC